MLAEATIDDVAAELAATLVKIEAIELTMSLPVTFEAVTEAADFASDKTALYDLTAES